MYDRNTLPKMRLPYIPSVIAVRPVILLTGFLGAGKTTLLRELLIAVKQKGMQSDVILNDYADANLDSATLEQYTQSIEPLTATCACCEGLDFLLDLSVKSSKAESDLLFVELNGTADPVPVVEAFTLLEDKLQLHPRWQVCVIDVRHFGKRGAYRDIEELQLQTASHIYFSHEEEEFSREAVIDEVKRINPYASIVDREDLIKMVLALGSDKKKRVIDDQVKEDTYDLNLIKKSEHHQQTHEFTACQILMPSHADEQVIRDWLTVLPIDVIRVKLLIGLSGNRDDRYLFERVGSVVSKYPQRVQLGKNVPNSAILIGPDLQIDLLQDLAVQYMLGDK